MPVLSPTTSPCRVVIARCLALVVVALLAAAISAPAAGAAPANYAGISTTGGTVFFTTTEQLALGDTDTRRDVYQRSFDSGVGAYVTREVSTGPTGGNDAFDAFFERASADGTRAFFSTDESLVAADVDHETDVYVRDFAAGTTALVTQGNSACAPACGNGAFDAGFAGADPRGSEAFFVTAEQLASADADSSVDVYKRDLLTNATVLVSAGGACAPVCGNGAFNATFRGVSADGSTAFFVTSEQLTSADIDTASDVYARDLPSDLTSLVSEGGSSNSSAAVFAGSSADGATAFFETDEGLVPGDTDGSNDVYRRAAGVTTLISDGSLPGFPANFTAASADGSTAFFVTAESLVGGADSNRANDVYEWQGGAPSLVTSGACCGSTFGSATGDGTKVVFTTTEGLDAADTDSSADVYEQTVGGGAPALVSQGAAACAPGCGNGAASAIFNRASSDASLIFFTTVEQLVPQDLDADADIYARDLGAGTTTLASPPGLLCPVGSCNAIFNGTSDDGTHVFFQTEERLTSDDVDSEIDVYEREGGQTRLVSIGNSVALGPATPVLTATNPASPGASTTPAILGQSDPNTSIKLYATADCSGAPVATGASSQLGGAGIVATVAAGSTTNFRATATDINGDTSACSTAISYTQQSAPPPPPPPPPDPGTGGGSGSGSGGSSIGTTRGSGRAFLIPQTRITFAPGVKTRARRPVFLFTDVTGQDGTTFSCKVDRRAWQPCSSPVKLKRLRWGKHTFQVTGTNGAGAQEPGTVKHTFKVVRG